MIPLMDSSSMASEKGDDSGIESSNADSGDNTVYIRISVPELKLQKCLQFSQEDSVWTAKQRVLSTLAKDLKDGMNYGLYCPPINGRAGKFLDEERPLKDYPLPGPIGFLEFKYKRRVYKLMTVNPRTLKKMHTKSNLKQFMESVKRSEVEKVNRTTLKGLDPNFHDHDSGETPLTLASTVSKPRSIILALVSGGAHVDFRNKEGLTPMHRACQNGNMEAIRTLLDLGASPNYKDTHGLTPLYHCVCHCTNSNSVEMLLHDHAVVGCSDDRGWTEVHQACKQGRVQHLEHLLFYGGEMNGQNSSGNTPLQVCAANNQESCARVLLFRGADKNIQNYANNDAFQVAVISGNLELANIIKNFRAEDIVPYQEVPKYNEKRRTTITQATLHNLVRSRSDPRLNQLFQDNMSKPPSPALSNNSLPQFAQDIFDPANAGALYNGHQRNYPDSNSDSPRSMSISSTGSMSGSFVSDHLAGTQQPLPRRGSLPPCLLPLGSFSRRSSVCSLPYSYPRQRLYPALPGRRFICVQSYQPECEAELSLVKGQFVEVPVVTVVSVGEQGYWEGRRADGREGWFPASHVSEVQMRNRRGGYPIKGGKPHSEPQESVVLNRQALAALCRDDENAPRTVALQKGKNGFGFVLRGAKSQGVPSSTLDFAPTPDFPALQYLDRVDRGSMADKVGLKPGDFVLEINHESVVNSTHEHAVQLIKASGDTLTMKVITVKPLVADGIHTHMDGTRTLPLKKKAPTPPKRNPHTYLTASGSLGTQAKSVIDTLAELDEEGEENFGIQEELEELGKNYTETALRPNKLDQTLARYEADEDRNMTEGYVTGMAVAKGVDPNNKTASISRRTKRLTSVPLDEIFERNDQGADYGQSGRGEGRGKPVVPVPGYSPGELNTHNKTQNGSVSMGRANSAPNMVPGLSLSSTEAEYARNITRVDVGREGNVSHSYAIKQEHQETSTNMSNVRMSNVANKDNGPYPGNDGIYAVPFKDGSRPHNVDIDSQGYARTGRMPGRPVEAPPVPPGKEVIPPPPGHSPPTPPSQNQSGEVVRIKTLNPGYANVSADIQARMASEETASSPYESSFRPNKGAKFAGRPSAPPPVHTRTSSMTSSLSSVSVEQSQQRSSPYATPEPITVQASVHSAQKEAARRSDPDPDYNDPEPDYDASERGRALQRPVITTATRVPAPPSPKPAAAPSHPFRQEDESAASEFGNAIKLAAIAREKRLQEEATKPAPVKVQETTITTSSVQQANIPPPPPMAPPPPPSGPPPEFTPKTSPVTVKRSPPPHIKKQLEETRRREESHAVLLAAVQKRRNIVDSGEQKDLASKIESRFDKDRKVQNTVFKSDQTKVELKTVVSPIRPVEGNSSTPKRESVNPIEPPKSEKTTSPPVKKIPPPPPPHSKPSNGQVPLDNGFSRQGNRDSVGSTSTDFIAMAEKARQQYLEKKGISTLERKKEEKERKEQEKTEESPTRKREAPKPLSPQNDHPSPQLTSQSASPPGPPGGVGVAGLANVVAQRAMARQKSYEALENNNNKVAGSQRTYKANIPAAGGTHLKTGPATPSKPSPLHTTDWSEKTVEIKGATVDYSHTETPRTERAAVTGQDNTSVADKKRLFEKQQTAGNKFIFPAKIDSNGVDAVPPPMIPPPVDFGSNGYHSNGQAPSGRDSSSLGSHQVTVRDKLSSRSPHTANSSVHSEGVATMVLVPEPEPLEQVDISTIPPPPLFDEYIGLGGAPEDAVSMVSSVSTLSTLSSADHDGGHTQDSPQHSRIPSGPPPSHPIAPPPPGFDDSLEGYADFIPPPMEFDANTSALATSPTTNSLRSVPKSPGYSVTYPAVKASRKAFSSKPIDSWTIMDVGDWLDSLQLSEHRDKFLQKRINGQKLMQMGRAELIALGVTQVGHRMNIERSIKKAIMQK